MTLVQGLHLCTSKKLLEEPLLLVTFVAKKDKHYICTQKFSDGTYMLTRIKNKEEKLRVNTNQIHAYFRHYFGGWE